jgi:hypothetical protein
MKDSRHEKKRAEAIREYRRLYNNVLSVHWSPERVDRMLKLKKAYNL